MRNLRAEGELAFCTASVRATAPRVAVTPLDHMSHAPFCWFAAAGGSVGVIQWVGSSWCHPLFFFFFESRPLPCSYLVCSSGGFCWLCSWCLVVISRFFSGMRLYPTCWLSLSCNAVLPLPQSGNPIPAHTDHTDHATPALNSATPNQPTNQPTNRPKPSDQSHPTKPNQTNPLNQPTGGKQNGVAC